MASFISRVPNEVSHAFPTSPKCEGCIIPVHVWDTLETSLLTADLHVLDQDNTRRRVEEYIKLHKFIFHE